MNLAERAALLPKSPGVYLFKSAKDEVLYVGKAVDLRARVNQYLAGHDQREMVHALISESVDVDVVVVNTEKDALLLECTLIQKYRPRYNVRLVDGGGFLYLSIDLQDEWPRYQVVRKRSRRKRSQVHFIGPITSGGQARKVLTFVERSFRLRTCSNQELRTRKRACLLYEMHRCLAPCVGLCTPEVYQAEVTQSLMFLQGRHQPLLKQLNTQMLQYSEQEAFEQAARTRDLILAIQASTSKQEMVDGRGGNKDIWGMYREGERGVLAVLPVREGRVQAPVTLRFEAAVDSNPALLSSLLNTWYESGEGIPDEVVLPFELPDRAALAEVLNQRRGRRVSVLTPKRGEKHRLMQLASKNAQATHIRQQSAAAHRRQILSDLKRICRLPTLPRRIECVDNSNIQGTDSVAAVVVFIDGRPSRAHYRRFVVKTVVGADDYATMREILHRRIRRGLAGDAGWELPDLIVVDGGRGQLNIALALLSDLGVKDVPVVGLSKPRTERKRGDRDTPDKIVLPNVREPLVLRNNHPVLHLLQSIRDEAHKTAVTFHRKRRRKRQLSSPLDDLPGIGPARRKTLLKHFGGHAAIRQATLAEIVALPGFGKTRAQNLLQALSEADDV